MMPDWNQCSALESIPAKMSGAWVFRGTRVPAEALFENLRDGARVDEFIEWFPGVSHEQVKQLLEFLRNDPYLILRAVTENENE
ncbi:MAG: DUF433 domain-containing protein [Chthoniobacteraceae bacterium]